MVLFNYATKEITAKIVYYGPGLCGKTTNLQFVYDSLPSNNKSKMLSLSTKTDRPNALPVREMEAEINKLTVPHFESVATTGIGVEETLKGITQLVLAHLIRKYGLEGSDPIDRDLQILNAQVAREQSSGDSL